MKATTFGKFLEVFVKRYYNDLRDLDVEAEPNFETLQHWVCDSICEATDGCEVEPDGSCEHGHRSWLLVLGLI